MEQQQTQQLNIRLEDTSEVTCEACGNSVFTEGLLMRRVSKFIAGTPNDSMIPISVFACTKCGHVNSEFLPQQLKQPQTEV